MKPREVMGTIYLSGQVMLPLEEAHKIQAILAKYAVGTNYVYRGGGGATGGKYDSVYFMERYDVPYVQVDKGEPKFDLRELTVEQQSAWIDMVRNSVGNDFLSPQDFVKLSETPK